MRKVERVFKENQTTNWFYLDPVDRTKRYLFSDGLVYWYNMNRNGISDMFHATHGKARREEKKDS
jgi:hypothetical protein